MIPNVPFDLLDGERHVWREPGPHTHPRTHPHHDRLGELLLPGWCLQHIPKSAFWHTETKMIPSTGGGLHPLCCAEHDDGWRGFLLCRRTGERHVHSLVPECPQQVRASFWLIQAKIFSFVVYMWSYLSVADITGCTTPPPTITATRTVGCCASMRAQTPDRSARRLKKSVELKDFISGV